MSADRDWGSGAPGKSANSHDHQGHRVRCFCTLLLAHLPQNNEKMVFSGCRTHYVFLLTDQKKLAKHLFPDCYESWRAYLLKEWVITVACTWPTLVSQALADGTVPVFLDSPAARAAGLEQRPVQLHHVLRAYNKDDIYHTCYAAKACIYVEFWCVSYRPARLWSSSIFWVITTTLLRTHH